MTYTIRHKVTQKKVREYFDFDTLDDVMDYFACDYFLKGVRWGQWSLHDFIVSSSHQHVLGKDCQKPCVIVVLPLTEKAWRCNSCGNPAPMSLEEVMKHVRKTQHYRFSNERWFRE